MRIVQIILFEFLLGYILQAFAIVLGLYAFNKRKIEIKKYIITSVIVAIVIYVTRLLPIAFGVHTVLDFVVELLLAILYLKIPVLSSLKANVINFLLILGLEFISSFIFKSIFGLEKLIYLMSNEPSRSLIALPSSLLFALTILLIYYFNNKKIIVKNGS